MLGNAQGAIVAYLVDQDRFSRVHRCAGVHRCVQGCIGMRGGENGVYLADQACLSWVYQGISESTVWHIRVPVVFILLSKRAFRVRGVVRLGLHRRDMATRLAIAAAHLGWGRGGLGSRWAGVAVG